MPMFSVSVLLSLLSLGHRLLTLAGVQIHLLSYHENGVQWPTREPDSRGVALQKNKDLEQKVPVNAQTAAVRGQRENTCLYWHYEGIHFTQNLECRK